MTVQLNGELHEVPEVIGDAGVDTASDATLAIELGSSGHCQLVEGSALLPRDIDASDRFQQAHVTASHSTNARVRSRRW